MNDFGLPEETLDVIRRRYAPPQDWTTDPQGWVAHRFPEAELWSRQRDILDAVRDNPRTAVKACHGPGKSWTASVVIAWWVDSNPADDVFVVTSAPTASQVRAILWRELNRRHKEGNLPGTMLQTEWKSPDGQLLAFGRKPADYSTSAFQGIHARKVLVVLDEAGGIPEGLWIAAESIASNEYARILAIGNPDDGQSHFAKVCDFPTWHVMTISAFDTPNLTGEKISKRLSEVLISADWVERRREEWGENSPIYKAKVLAEFPVDATDGVIPASWLARARNTELTADGPIEAGLDVAAGGADRSVLWVRQGPVALERRILQGESDPLKLADWVLNAIHELGITALKVDAIGVGWSVGAMIEDHARQGLHSCAVVPVNVSESADDKESFYNTRAELWWNMRELCRTAQVDLQTIDDDDAHELTIVRYHRKNPRTRIQVEKKDEVKKRSGRSPDLADALLLAFHVVTWEPDLSGVDQTVEARLPKTS